MLYILNVNVVIIPEKDYSKSDSPWKCHNFLGENARLEPGKMPVVIKETDQLLRS